MKNRTNENRRGFTLAELTVVLAVMTIVAALAIAFSSMISERRAQSQARLDAMNDISVAEKTIENWIQKNAAITVESAQLSTEGSSIGAQDGTLSIGKNAVYTFERVKEITFSQEKKIQENNNQPTIEHTIYFCKVAYTLTESDTPEYYTFCVYKQTVTS